MRKATLIVCLVSCLGAVTLAKGVAGQVSRGIRLESVRIDRVDADHFKAVLELINETKTDIYIQSTISRSDTPYPLYLERRVGTGWQIVAPCVDVMPASSIAIKRGRSHTIDLVHSLELPSNCKIRRIDPAGEYRWRIEVFKNKTDLMQFEKTEGRSGKVVNIVSKPFLIGRSPA